MWPTSVDGWLGLGMTIVGIIATAVTIGWKAFAQPKINKIENDMALKRQGINQTLSILDAATTSQGSKLNEVERKMQQLEFGHLENQREIGRMEGTVRNLMQSLERRLEADIEISRKLAVIESHLSVAEAIEKTGERVVEAAEHVVTAMLSPNQKRLGGD